MDKIEKIFENNKLWVAEKLSIDPNYFNKLSKGQNPEFLYIGCSDSRVTAEELMGAKPDQLAAMKPFAEKGAPTIQQLGASFTTFAGSLAQSGEAAPSGAMAYLQRFVKVRPVGELGGNTPPDIVRTIEAALAKGNVTEALSALAKLPEPARMPSANWAKLAGDRDSAAKALTALQDSALTALRTAKP